MKILIYLLLIVLTSVTITAQEIDQSWFLYSGVEYTQVHTFDPDTTKFSVRDFGLDQTWDFSNQRPNNLIDTTWYLEIEDMEFGSNFPGANLGKRNETPFYDWEFYYRVTNDTIYDYGVVSTRKLPPMDTLISVAIPNQNFYMINGFSIGDTLWSSELEVTNIQFQGIGKVITSNLDTFENCILIKSEFPMLGDITYRWYQNDFTKEVALFAPEESANPTVPLTWIIDYDDGKVSATKKLQINSFDKLKVWVNNSMMYLENPVTKKDLQISFYDYSGRLIVSETYIVAQGLNTYDLPKVLQENAHPIIGLLIDKQTKQFKGFKF